MRFGRSWTNGGPDGVRVADPKRNGTRGRCSTWNEVEGESVMRRLLKTTMAALLAIGCAAGLAGAQGLKDPKDVHIAFVVHGSAGDAYWTVVKRGVDDAAALTGAKVDYYAPQIFDVVEQGRLLDAAVARKPDGLAI